MNAMRAGMTLTLHGDMTALIYDTGTDALQPRGLNLYDAAAASGKGYVIGLQLSDYTLNALEAAIAHYRGRSVDEFRAAVANGLYTTADDNVKKTSGRSKERTAPRNRKHHKRLR